VKKAISSIFSRGKCRGRTCYAPVVRFREFEPQKKTPPALERPLVSPNCVEKRKGERKATFFPRCVEERGDRAGGEL